jgi:hypothetical protein
VSAPPASQYGTNANANAANTGYQNAGAAAQQPFTGMSNTANSAAAGYGGYANQGLGYLASAAAGKQPSAGQIAETQGVQQGMQAQLAAANSARGGPQSQAASAGAAAQQGGTMAAQGISQGAQMRAQEMANAQQALTNAGLQGQTAQGQLGLGAGTAGANTNLSYQGMGQSAELAQLNADTAGNAQNLQAQEANQQATQKGIGAVTGLFSSAAGMAMSDMRVKQGIRDEGIHSPVDAKTDIVDPSAATRQGLMASLTTLGGGGGENPYKPNPTAPSSDSSKGPSLSDRMGFMQKMNKGATGGGATPSLSSSTSSSTSPMGNGGHQDTVGGTYADTGNPGGDTNAAAQSAMATPVGDESGSYASALGLGGADSDALADAAVGSDMRAKEGVIAQSTGGGKTIGAPKATPTVSPAPMGAALPVNERSSISLGRLVSDEAAKTAAYSQGRMHGALHFAQMVGAGKIKYDSPNQNWSSDDPGMQAGLARMDAENERLASVYTAMKKAGMRTDQMRAAGVSDDGPILASTTPQKAAQQASQRKAVAAAPRPRAVPSPQPVAPVGPTALPDTSIGSDAKNKERVRKDDAGSSDKSSELDSFLDSLHPYSYRYKDPSMEPTREPTGGRYLGVMAQNLEKSPVGPQIVKEGPRGKELEQGALLSALAAGTGELHERLSNIEAMMRKKGRNGRNAA